MFTLVPERTIMLVILAMTADTTGSQTQFIAGRSFVALGTTDVLVLAIQLESGFIVVEIPVLPVTRVVASLARFSQRAFVSILFFVT